MKKLLGTALALTLIAPPGPASAELLKNLKISGQLDWQNTSARNAFDFATRDAHNGAGTTTGANNDRLSASHTRVMLNADWDLLDDVHSQVSMSKNDRAWAGAGAGAGTQIAGAGVAGGQALTGGGGAGVTDQVLLMRANIGIDKLMGRFDTRVGRQYYGEAGDLVAFWGPKDSHGLFVTAIDAFRVDTECDWMSMTGVAGTTVRGTAAITAGTSAANVTQANTHVKGVDIWWKNLPLRIGTFIFHRNTQGAGGLGVAPGSAAGSAATGMNDQLWVYGVKLRGEAGGGWLSLDLAKNGGQDRLSGAGAGCGVKSCAAGSANYIGTALLMDLGYNIEAANVGGITPWFNFGWGSGRSDASSHSNDGFTAIASDYRPGIMNRRFAGVGAVGAAVLGSAIDGGLGAGGVGTTGLTNRVVWGFGTNFTPSALDQLTAGLSWWDYRFQRDTMTTAGTGTLAQGNKHIGSEVGLTVDWRHSENVNLGLGYAHFTPGGMIKESIRSTRTTIGSGDNPAQMWFADLTVKF